MVDKYTNMLVLCKSMFIIIEAIQNNDKYWDTYLDQALGALLCLVCSDQGSMAHVCCCCYEQQQQLLQSRLIDC